MELHDYDRSVLGHARWVLVIIALITAGFGWQAQFFRLDASAETLVLEDDDDLRFFRQVKRRYGNDNFLVLTYSTDRDLFSAPVLAQLGQIRDAVLALDGVEKLASILDVPLLSSPPLPLSELRRSVPDLRDPRTELALARQELLASPFYGELLISRDAATTAMLIYLRQDSDFLALQQRREQLRDQRDQGGLTAAELAELAKVEAAYLKALAGQLAGEAGTIAQVRALMASQKGAELHLGGVPMIAADSMAFIRHDLTTFGVAVLLFLVVILAVAFHLPRWVLLPLLTCAATAVIMLGLLGLLDWPVTVVSSNFISLMLILTLSLAIHLIVRYQELQALYPNAHQHSLVLTTVRKKLVPCLYTALTTMVAFGSLLVSGIRPVIDFGWMMTIGTAVSFLLAFSLFPAALMLLRPGPVQSRRNLTGRLTRALGKGVQRHQGAVFVAYGLLAVLSVWGLSRLAVENRFIDYFQEDTEIYQGMVLIDRELGGTTPLELIVEAPPEPAPSAPLEPDPLLEELGIDPDELAGEDEDAGFTARSHWFNVQGLAKVRAIHHYLESLPETGQVLSLASSAEVLREIDPGAMGDNFLLSVLYQGLPDGVKELLIAPFLSGDGDQLRITLRVFETDPGLRRAELLARIERDLVAELGLAPEQFRLTGMLVLYNNMLQSLFRSQILSIAVVFLAISAMFWLLFRRLSLALIALVPNLIAAAAVLGLMGWLAIPLDMMTITIAAICVGIGVDNSIHYVHRYLEELKGGDGWQALHRSHASIGRAMYYTSVTITLGFAILVLSNFIPSLYFGLFTGLAMMMALLANLTLLPLLLARCYAGAH
ncbi:MMPL family transporter [Gallaecimonas sp. GXIMD4217]|uniref:efflux RND transporter permease subunit n=1 Tax=Gallaecimonas sp. GXIMD4217 TaxID=3131927 RepID=UPI00311B3E13